jgi:hypothetical protein
LNSNPRNKKKKAELSTASKRNLPPQRKTESGAASERSLIHEYNSLETEERVADVLITGQAQTKSEAVARVEKAIDRALAPARVRLVPPERSD